MCAIGLLAYAQKPVKGNKGFAFGITGVPSLSVNTKNSPTGSLNFRYQVSDRWAARVGFRYGSKKNTVKSDTTGNGIDTSQIIKSRNWAFNLGIQKSLGKIPKLDPYVGAEFYLGGMGGSYDLKTEVVSPANPNIFGDYAQTHIADYGKGKFFGARVFAGVHYFFADHFAIGGEFGYGYQMKSTKNGTTTVTVQGSTFGNPGTTYSTNSAKTEEKTFDTNGTGTIILTVMF